MTAEYAKASTEPSAALPSEADDICSGPGRNGEVRCDNRVAVTATGYCLGHHTQLKRGEEIRPLRNRSNKGVLCTGPGHDGQLCGIQVHNRATGLCSSHDTQVRKGRELTVLQKRVVIDSDVHCVGPGLGDEGCDRLARFKKSGLCWTHHQQQKAGTALLPLKPYRHSDDPRGVCNAPDCGRDLYCQGLCTGHYNQRLAGRPIGPLASERRSIPAAARDEDGNKYCHGCNQWRDITMFSVNRFRSDGLSEFCSTCRMFNRIRNVYGLEREDYEEMLARQGGRCAICPNTADRGKPLAVDHDHSCCSGAKTCGECIRGLLCDSCNLGLGYFSDDPDRLIRAAAYLAAGPIPPHDVATKG